MLKRLLLLPALLLSVTACDGPFEIKGDKTPGDPFGGSNFARADEARSDLVSVEETCERYCNLQDACEDWESSECFDDCVAPKLEASFTAAAGDVTPAVCGEAFASALNCLAAADCGTATGCDELVYDYVDCAAG